MLWEADSFFRRRVESADSSLEYGLACPARHELSDRPAFFAVDELLLVLDAIDALESVSGRTQIFIDRH